MQRDILLVLKFVSTSIGSKPEIFPIFLHALESELKKHVGDRLFLRL